MLIFPVLPIILTICFCFKNNGVALVFYALLQTIEQ